MEVPLACVEDVSDGEGEYREESVSPYGMDSMPLPEDRLRDMLQVRRGSVASTRSRGAGGDDDGYTQTELDDPSASGKICYLEKLDSGITRLCI
ncbi:hypothetical protein ElyMa_002090900 [Elysia marginata]|uniref:Uncharacterized protein n=1 Tax=Elysia marginata TaxID=1093978 RepID=A0AAV4FDE6_9GAST|nr:hypothetical protein ElyMa_002090900 [Elysia marginata]